MTKTSSYSVHGDYTLHLGTSRPESRSKDGGTLLICELLLSISSRTSACCQQLERQHPQSYGTFGCVVPMQTFPDKYQITAVEASLILRTRYTVIGLDNDVKVWDVRRNG
ncbi:hypothetical protein HPP92_028341 [Vanilla planifolia]|uniref:Uncharacterized protein n=1 Tax=Vanilla planifolia TaxID=51239 RepID=A0A835P5Z0_VANPL|nr:hypothetical protein HPP92_028341 [Vanilla planifolia]